MGELELLTKKMRYFKKTSLPSSSKIQDHSLSQQLAAMESTKSMERKTIIVNFTREKERTGDDKPKEPSITAVHEIPGFRILFSSPP